MPSLLSVMLKWAVAQSVMIEADEVKSRLKLMISKVFLITEQPFVLFQGVRRVSGIDYLHVDRNLGLKEASRGQEW